MSETKVRPRHEEVTESATKLVPRYKVLVHDDNITHFQFVVWVICYVWRKFPQDALQITLEAHAKRVALVAVEPFERAEFHVDQAHSLARARKFPLKFTLEPE